MIRKTVGLGFSLIELMVVIAIVAVLAAIALPAYKNYVIKSQIATLTPLLNNITDQNLEYFNKHREFPTAHELDLGYDFFGQRGYSHVDNPYLEWDSSIDMLPDGVSGSHPCVTEVALWLSIPDITGDDTNMTYSGYYGNLVYINPNGIFEKICYYEICNNADCSVTHTGAVIPGCVNVNLTTGSDWGAYDPMRDALIAAPCDL